MGRRTGTRRERRCAGGVGVGGARGRGVCLVVAAPLALGPSCSCACGPCFPHPAQPRDHLHAAQAKRQHEGRSTTRTRKRRSSSWRGVQCDSQCLLPHTLSLYSAFPHIPYTAVFLKGFLCFVSTLLRLIHTTEIHCTSPSFACPYVLLLIHYTRIIYSPLCGLNLRIFLLPVLRTPPLPAARHTSLLLLGPFYLPCTCCCSLRMRFSCKYSDTIRRIRTLGSKAGSIGSLVIGVMRGLPLRTE